MLHFQAAYGGIFARILRPVEIKCSAPSQLVKEYLRTVCAQCVSDC
jgi:hypothetical protein